MVHRFTNFEHDNYVIKHIKQHIKQPDGGFCFESIHVDKEKAKI